MYNIDDVVSYTVPGEPKNKIGTIVELFSDMESYEEMKLQDGIPFYKSKKLKKFVPVKPKNMDTVYLEVKNTKNDGDTEFIYLKDIVSNG